MAKLQATPDMLEMYRAYMAMHGRWRYVKQQRNYDETRKGFSMAKREQVRELAVQVMSLRKLVDTKRAKEKAIRVEVSNHQEELTKLEPTTEEARWELDSEINLLEAEERKTRKKPAAR